ncbi:MAG: hypothetical protein SGJ11_08980 [Phycisphaerae bacterium]|nr:hypothetical protein [Phycisphaerae bacterium]
MHTQLVHTVALGTGLLLMLARSASGQHDGDINPSVAPAGDGFARIQTNAIDKDGAVTPGVRVFGPVFGESGFPEFTSEPGFDALPGTFAPGTRVGFHAPQGFLLFNGAGLAPVTTERLNVKFATLESTIGPAPDEGFDLAVQEDGGWHRHLSYTILDTSMPLPPIGIYVLPMTLYSTDPAVLESELFWMVFDYGAGEAAHDAAIEWVEANLVATCPADLDDDQAVGAGDLATLLGQWGSAGSADLDGDGIVNAGDLASLLGAWGRCPGRK